VQRRLDKRQGKHVHCYQAHREVCHDWQNETHTYNGEECCKVGRGANGDIIHASVYVGAGTPTAKEFEAIEHRNRTTDHLLDY
jgi:hypothetical protein